MLFCKKHYCQKMNLKKSIFLRQLGGGCNQNLCGGVYPNKPQCIATTDPWHQNIPTNAYQICFLKKQLEFCHYFKIFSTQQGLERKAKN